MLQWFLCIIALIETNWIYFSLRLEFNLENEIDSYVIHESAHIFITIANKNWRLKAAKLLAEAAHSECRRQLLRHATVGSKSYCMLAIKTIRCPKSQSPIPTANGNCGQWCWLSPHSFPQSLSLSLWQFVCYCLLFLQLKLLYLLQKEKKKNSKKQSQHYWSTRQGERKRKVCHYASESSGCGVVAACSCHCSCNYCNCSRARGAVHCDIANVAKPHFVANNFSERVVELIGSKSFGCRKNHRKLYARCRSLHSSLPFLLCPAISCCLFCHVVKTFHA